MFRKSFSNKEGKLNIAESRMLGNQYIMVVEYEDNKILAGCWAGKIDYLTSLQGYRNDFPKLEPEVRKLDTEIMKRFVFIFMLVLGFGIFADQANSQTNTPSGLSLNINMGEDADGEQDVGTAIQILLLMTLPTMGPSIVVLMTILPVSLLSLDLSEQLWVCTKPLPISLSWGLPL